MTDDNASNVNIVLFVISSLITILLLFAIKFNIGIIVSIFFGCITAYYIIDNTTVSETEFFDNIKCSNRDSKSALNSFIYYTKKICKHNPPLFASLSEKIKNFLELHAATTSENFSANFIELDRLKRDIQNDFYMFIFSVPSDQKYITTINQGEIILSSFLSQHMNLLTKQYLPTHDSSVNGSVDSSVNGEPIPFSEYKDIFSPISFEIA